MFLGEYLGVKYFCQRVNICKIHTYKKRSHFTVLIPVGWMVVHSLCYSSFKDHVFMCSLAIWIPLTVKCLFNLLLLFNWTVSLLSLRVLCIFWKKKKPFFIYTYGEYFSPWHATSFLKLSFEEGKLLFLWGLTDHFFFYDVCRCVLSKKSLPSPNLWRFSSLFSCAYSFFFFF